jgi:hypothetical protein
MRDIEQSLAPSFSLDRSVMVRKTGLKMLRPFA